jgi:hypothetical protein
MTNGLLSAIQDQVDPFYKDPMSVEKNIIYIHQQKSIKSLIAIDDLLVQHGLEEYREPVCAFVGETGAMRVTANDLKRFKDGDYSKLPQKVEADAVIPVHPELTDHYIRYSFYSSYGCRKNNMGGSPEVVLAPLYFKSYSKYVSFLVEKIKILSDKFYEQEQVYGYTPESHAKKIKEKNPEATRAPKLHLVNEIVDMLNLPSKDAMIYIPMDAFGHFCITLSNRGYTNIYTDKDYDMSIGLGHIPETVKFISQRKYESMDFDAVTGNPPFGKGGGLALRFLNNCADRVRAKNGQILLILPKSIKKGSSNFNKINRDLELVSSKDCDPKDFAASIDACIQEWKIGEKSRPLEVEYKEHPHLEFLSYENRYDADIFVGGDGAGASGRVFLPGEKNPEGKRWTDYEKSSSHNYIRVRPDENNTKEQILERIISLGQKGDNSFRDIAMGTTNGIPHFGKKKLVTIYTKRYGNGHKEQA